jgi:hypothetical protein
MTTTESMLQMFVGLAAVAGLTWFLSSRPRLFLRVFCPRDELFRVGRQILRPAEFRHGMRVMAGLPFGVACVFGLVGLWLGR